MLHAVTVGSVALEEVGQLVVVELSAGQCPTDVTGDVVVAEADRISVAVSPLAHLGSRPHADSWHGGQSSLDLL